MDTLLIRLFRNTDKDGRPRNSLYIIYTVGKILVYLNLSSKHISRRLRAIYMLAFPTSSWYRRLHLARIDRQQFISHHLDFRLYHFLPYARRNQSSRQQDLRGAMGFPMHTVSV
jgi:hypothetical protein